MLLITSTSNIGSDNFRQKLIDTKNSNVNFIAEQPLTVNELMELFDYSTERNVVAEYNVFLSSSIVPNFVGAPKSTIIEIITEKGNQIKFLIQNMSDIQSECFDKDL